MQKQTQIIIVTITILSMTSLVFLTIQFSEENSNSSSIFLFANESKIEAQVNPFPCGHFKKRTLFAHRGGNITKHQENSLEVFLDSARNNRAIEMDLVQLGSSEIIAFHDENSLEKTVVNLNLLEFLEIEMLLSLPTLL